MPIEYKEGWRKFLKKSYVTVDLNGNVFIEKDSLEDFVSLALKEERKRCAEELRTQPISGLFDFKPSDVKKLLYEIASRLEGEVE